MRKSRQEAAETRKRIVDSAAVQFRQKGIGATGLADLMAGAGLTHGGFYKHFEAKDELVIEACAVAARAATESFGEETQKRGGLEGAIANYLSRSHRDNPGESCLFAALGCELARASDNVRDSATASFEAFLEVIMAAMPDRTPAAAKREATVILSTMIGAMMLSRVVSDQALSNAVLRNAREHLCESLGR